MLYNAVLVSIVKEQVAISHDAMFNDEVRLCSIVSFDMHATR
jgi:hypothetical protein